MRNQKAFFGLLLFLAAPAGLWAANGDSRDAGMALYRAGQYAKALVYFKSAVQADPNDWEAYQDMGNSYVKMNDNLDARDAYEKSLQINPNNSTLRVLVDSMGNGNNSSPEVSQDQPAAAPPSNAEDNVTPKIEPWHKHPGAVSSYTTDGGINRVDRARLWVKGEIGYNYSAVTDLINSAGTINNGTFVPGNAIDGSDAYAGSSLADNSGLEWGGEVGFLVSPNFGIGIGARVIRTNDYTANVSYDTGDTESLTLSPMVVPMTLDLYLFLPDSGGRFFISGGAGYYAGRVHVDQTTTTNNFFHTPNGSDDTDNWSGDLDASTLGFQVAIGRDFAINRKFAIEIFARGRYAKITNFQGTLYEANNGGAQTYGLASSSTGPTLVDADLPQYINGTYNERPATIDFTGFDIGAALVFYHF